jgi:hypothetical protein
MSALPPKADMGTQSRDVRFVPKADIMQCSNPLGSIRRCTVEFSPAAGEGCKVLAHGRHILDREKLEPIFASDVSLLGHATE